MASAARSLAPGLPRLAMMDWRFAWKAARASGFSRKRCDRFGDWGGLGVLLQELADHFTTGQDIGHSRAT